MGASSKTKAEPTGRRRQDRRREIAGILLMALGLFSGLSLVSMHVGDGRMMGPGGAATASALYAFLGLAAYPLVAWMLVASVRCFRARRVVDGFGEGMGALLLAGAVPTLLYLPFARSVHAQHGPGGWVGELFGEVSSSFVGPVGAGLAATAFLAIALLLITDVSMREVMVVLAWALRHAQHGIVVGATAAWRVARAAFPEKDDRGDVREGESEKREVPVVVEAGAAHADADEDGDEDADEDEDEDGKGIPVARGEELSDAIRVGEAKPVSEPIADERSEMAAIVAEVAAAEEPAPAAEPEAEPVP